MVFVTNGFGGPGDGQIAAVPLSDDLSRLWVRRRYCSGRPTPLEGKLLQAKRLCDGRSFPVPDEGQFLLMLWSSFTEKDMPPVMAKSKSGEIHGPRIQRQEPLYFLDGAHSMLFHTFDGRLMMSLHCPEYPYQKKILTV